MINKEEALKRLVVIEQETKELKKIIEQPVSIFDRVKNYSDVCRELRINEDHLLNLLYDKKIAAYIKIQYIAKLFNDDWQADWSNNNQYKYYPWFTKGLAR